MVLEKVKEASHLAAIAVTVILVPCHVVKYMYLQLIWRVGTCRCN